MYHVLRFCVRKPIYKERNNTTYRLACDFITIIHAAFLMFGTVTISSHVSPCFHKTLVFQLFVNSLHVLRSEPCHVFWKRIKSTGWLKLNVERREIGWEGVDWICVAQDREQWRAFVSTVMNLRFP
jgi:hypothetical protein